MGPLASLRKMAFFSKAHGRSKQPCPCPVREPGKPRLLLIPVSTSVTWENHLSLDLREPLKG